MTPLRRLHVGVLAVVLATAAGTAGLRALNDADPVSVDDAVARFRGSQPPTAAPGGPGTPTPSATATRQAGRGSATPEPGATAATGSTPGATTGPRATAAPAAPAAGDDVPPEGVYVFQTTGHETGDAGPMHARHDYPDRTTMTITRSGCGSSNRWEPVEDRWDDVTDCVVGNGTQIRVYDSQHSFFGVTERYTYQCGGESWFRPPTTRAGFRWEFSCVTDGARTHTLGRVVGVEQVSIGDYTGKALHISYDTTMTGRTEGTNPTEFWLALDEPFLLRRVSRVDAKVRTDFGTLDYHEEYETRLVSRRPRT